MCSGVSTYLPNDLNRIFIVGRWKMSHTIITKYIHSRDTYMHLTLKQLLVIFMMKSSRNIYRQYFINLADIIHRKGRYFTNVQMVTDCVAIYAKEYITLVLYSHTFKSNLDFHVEHCKPQSYNTQKYNILRISTQRQHIYDVDVTVNYITYIFRYTIFIINCNHK